MSLFKKDHRCELILCIILIIYLILGFKTPTQIAHIVDSLVGKIILFIIVIYLFIYANTILAILFLFVTFHLLQRSTNSTWGPQGLGNLSSYAPSEIKKNSQFTAFNQFPYTLEQEVVAKMGPIANSGSSLNKPSYKPLLDNNYDASPIHSH